MKYLTGGFFLLLLSLSLARCLFHFIITTTNAWQSCSLLLLLLMHTFLFRLLFNWNMLRFQIDGEIFPLKLIFECWLKNESDGRMKQCRIFFYSDTWRVWWERSVNELIFCFSHPSRLLQWRLSIWQREAFHSCFLFIWWQLSHLCRTIEPNKK